MTRVRCRSASSAQLLAALLTSLAPAFLSTATDRDLRSELGERTIRRILLTHRGNP